MQASTIHNIQDSSEKIRRRFLLTSVFAVFATTLYPLHYAFAAFAAYADCSHCKYDPIAAAFTNLMVWWASPWGTIPFIATGIATIFIAAKRRFRLALALAIVTVALFILSCEIKTWINDKSLQDSPDWPKLKKEADWLKVKKELEEVQKKQNAGK